jgi:phosphoglycerol transferase MdoB-like AlkP superfamily enzyme
MFSEIPEVNNKTDKPMFVFAHFILPHPPFTFGPNGESINPESLELGNNNWKNKEGYLNQVEFANNETQLIIEKILSYDDNSIIIIQGDHGSQFTMNWDDPNIDMINERMSILNSIYFPNEDKQFLYDSITPVNTFRVVFNTYLNGTYSYVDDKQYFSTYDQPFVFDDVTDKLQ